MYLKRIVLQGFKSFAKRTVVDFNDGVTAIVGPNGCGKSNIVDAFRWVMGEQSAKSMRGEKMHDVIFSGTGRQKISNFAEVTLTFAEVGDLLPVPYDEVEVSRRYYRSGESEYRINQQVVRQKDVHALFWDSGLGKDSFAIFEQGKVDELILMSPEERRAAFEQVAGIKRFRERRKEAQRKLSQVEINLSRINDLQRQNRRRLQLLERQAEAASLYQKRKERLDLVEKSVLRSKWETEERKAKASGQALAVVHEQLEKLKFSESKEDATAIRLKQQVVQRDGEVKELTEVWYRQKGDKAAKKVQLDGVTERLTTLRKKIAHLNDEELRLDSVDQDATDVAYQQWQNHQSELKRLQARAQQLRLEQLQEQKVQAALVEKVHRLTITLREKSAQLCAKKGRCDELRRELSLGRLRLEELEKEQAVQLSKANKLQKQFDKLKNRVEKERGELDDISQKLDQARHKVGQVRPEVAEIRARQSVLVRLRQSMEGSSEATKRLVKQFGDQVSPLYQHLSLEEGSEAAYASALRAYGQTLIAEDVGAVVAFAKQESLKDVSVASKELLQNLQVNISERQERGSVSIEGIFVDERGVIFFPSDGQGAPFLREAELNKLQRKLQAKEKQQAQVEQLVDELKQSFKEVSNKVEVTTQDLKRVEKEVMGANFAAEKGKADHQFAQQVAARQEQELANLQQQIDQFEVEVQAVEKEEVSAKQEVAKSKNQEKSEQALENCLAQLQLVTEQVQLAAATHRQLVDKLERCKRVKKEQVETQSEIDRLEERCEALKVAVVAADTSTAELSAKKEKLEKELSQWQSELAAIEGKVKEKMRQLSEVEQEAHRLELAITTAKSTANNYAQELRDRFEIEPADVESVKDPLIKSGGSDCELTFFKICLPIAGRPQRDVQMREVDFGKDQPQEGPHRVNQRVLEGAEEEVRTLRRELDRAGPVNLCALDEFETTKQEFELAQVQLDDLTTSREELVEIIERLDKVSNEQFSSTFTEVREQFKQQFKVLFNGGEADLVLTEEGTLEGGVEIVAKPPGKRMRSITLLSGGEKCLTAMALLFAFFSVKPAPFCILDEMDAPLDDANISRFLDVVRPFKQSTQFVIVTHNKKTMSFADVLFGVSMEEAGVTTLVSVVLDEAVLTV